MAGGHAAMIFTSIIILLIGLWNLIFYIIPTLPAMPTAITDGTAWFFTTIGSVVSILNYIFTAPLLAAAITVILAVLTWDGIYWPILWVVKKIPWINIK